MNVDLNLWPDKPLETEGDNQGCPSLTPYLLKGEGPFPGIVVLPGGGYMRRADHEGERVARWLNRIGISAFVLNYRVFPFHYPTQLQDAQRAIRMIRYKAAEWQLDPGRVGILGFSAGGHLASTAGTHYDNGDLQAIDPVERQSSRPDLMVLCYPVITMGIYAHEGSKVALLGDRKDDPRWVSLLSNETQITDDTPPTFLWHTVDDQGVPVENSLLFAESLRRHRVPFELHLFENGQHGLGLAEEHPEARAWPTLCEAWLVRRQFLKK